MNTRYCYLFVFNGFSDWEASLLMPGLNQFTDFKVKVFSVDGRPVRSMGGVRVMPDLKLPDTIPADMELLILPGGTAWEKGANEAVIQLVDGIVRTGKTVAAICGATLFMARHGYLNGIRHTSNHILYLQENAPAYQGEDWYVNKPCVSEGNIITANGTAIAEFAGMVFNHFNFLQNNAGMNFWFQFFRKLC